MPSENHSLEGARLIVAGLTRRFGGVTAVNELSFTLEPGEFLAVVGPNGAGKSTLFQLITGVIPPTHGSIRLGETELKGLPSEVIASFGVGRTFQTSRVFPALSIWDSVCVGLSVAWSGSGHTGKRINPLQEVYRALVRPRAFQERERQLNEEVEATLKLFGDRLWPRRFDRADSLSYANRRRLELARALVSKPILLLLDEPTAGMNPTETAELTTLVGQLHAQRKEMTVILVEHKLDVVRNLADRVLVMDHGKQLAAGSPDEVLRDTRVIEAYLGRPKERMVAKERG